MRAFSILALTLLLVSGCQRAAPPPSASLAPIDTLRMLKAQDSGGFALASAPREFSFPQDHGPHASFRDEWWYFTGQLAAADGEQFGFELTFFRLGLLPPLPQPERGWRARQVYAGHFAVSDISRGHFYFATRYARDALGLAGAQAQPFGVRVADWSVTAADAGAPAGLKWRLSAADGDYEVQLQLSTSSAPVLNGEAGLSRKSAESGAASYYYSIPRLQATGTISRGAQQLPVSGWAWLDREWGSGSLGPDQQGWDWYALNLNDGSSLMFYALRDRDGARDPHSAGTWVDANGRVTPLRNADVDVSVLKHWDSPRGGLYPAQWQVRVPSLALALTVTARLPDQELATQPRYWEGAVAAQGLRHNTAVAAQGYVELVGYAQAQASSSTPSAVSAPGH